MQAHRGPGWSTEEPPASLPPSRRASLLSHPAASLLFSHTHPPAPSGGPTPGRHSRRAALVEPRAGRRAHGTGASTGRAAHEYAGDRRAPRARTPGDAHPLPRARPGESERRAPARTPETELYYLAPSRAPPRWAFKQLSDITSQGFFSPLSLVAVRPSVPAGGRRRRRREESGKRKNHKLEPSDPTTNTPVINPPPQQICLSSRCCRRSLLVSALSLLLGYSVCWGWI